MLKKVTIYQIAIECANFAEIHVQFFQKCYAEVMARRLKAMGQKKYSNGFLLTIHEDDLDEPYRWKGSHNVFVCSMADLFHTSVPVEFIDKVMKESFRIRNYRFKIYPKNSLIPAEVWKYDTESILEGMHNRLPTKNIKREPELL